jgi:hypothetical protein
MAFTALSTEIGVVIDTLVSFVEVNSILSLITHQIPVNYLKADTLDFELKILFIASLLP